ncbi:MAG: SUMF1/EgtB/PvdO family nonheme iron enzyme [Planctomycetaceae bacterium]|nr:SUMF1/EgtB/PvdO family nonheme iron enzyme [Planctomycetaceae bacterium]
MKRFLVFVALMSLVGCGGSEAPPSSPPPAVAPAPTPVKPKVDPQAVAQQKAATPGASKTTGKGREAEADLSKFTSNDWETEEVHRNFEVVPASKAVDQSTYIAFIPEKGADSTTLQIVPEEKQPVRTSPPKANKLPQGFVSVSQEVSEEGWPLRIRCEADGMELVFIPAQVARVGSNLGPADAQPEHPAFVSAFYMDVHEVTVGQYEKFREDVRVEKKTAPVSPPSNVSATPNHPVLGVQWRFAEAYAQRYGRALPTEAEWEAAGRGELGLLHPWGNGRALWGQPRQPGQITEVGMYPADTSMFDVMDLAGNAREWCADWYRADSFSEALEQDGSPRRDWTGPKTSRPTGHRVVKGSSTEWELYARGHVNQSDEQPDIGFRCVLHLPQTQ